jgi:hypothetical protein
MTLKGQIQLLSFCAFKLCVDVPLDSHVCTFSMHCLRTCTCRPEGQANDTEGPDPAAVILCF